MSKNLSLNRFEADSFENAAVSNEQLLESSQPVNAQEIERDHISPDFFTGLGREAVAYNLSVTDYAHENNLSGEKLETLLNRRNQAEKEIINEQRERLEELTPMQVSRLNLLMSHQPESAWIDQALGVEDKGKDKSKNYVERLLAKDENGEDLVNNETFVNFLEWHNHALAQEQLKLEEYLAEHKGELIDGFAARIEKAQQNGWLPSSAGRNLSRLQEVKLLVDDGLHTSLTSTDGDYRSSLQEDGSIEHTIALAPTHLKNPGTAAGHEYIHALRGEEGLLPDEERTADQSTLDRLGGMYKLFGRNLGGISMDEAVVTHLDISMELEEIDTIDPQEKSEQKQFKTYSKERRLLQTLCEHGAVKIDIRDFMNVYFEDAREAEELGEESATAQLRKQLHEAFTSESIVRKIANMNSKHEVDDITSGLKPTAAA